MNCHVRNKVVEQKTDYYEVDKEQESQLDGLVGVYEEMSNH